MSFLYFAYASNMLAQRMHINCTSASKLCIAELKNYRLAFCGFGKQWNGSTATYMDDENSSVWGVVWKISKEQQEVLDKQESGYKPFNVVVHSADSGELNCRIYQHLTNSPIGIPSLIYKTVIIEGAIENKLPPNYIEYLKDFKDNGYKGPINVPVNVYCDPSYHKGDS